MAKILWLASYPKSGNTWVRIFLHNYLFDTAEPQDLNHLNLVARDSYFGWYENLTAKSVRDLNREECQALRCRAQENLAASSPSDILAKTHCPVFDAAGQPLVNFSVSSGAIYIIRNPMDVCLSQAKFWGHSYDDIITSMASQNYCGLPDAVNVWEYYGNWSEHVTSWTATAEAGIFLLRYEDLLQHPIAKFGRLVEFLQQQPPATERLARAIKFSTFEQLQKSEKDHGFEEQSRPGHVFFRSGKDGEGKETLSRAQIDRIVSHHGEVMEKYGYLP